MIVGFYLWKLIFRIGSVLKMNNTFDFSVRNVLLDYVRLDLLFQYEF